MTNWKKLLRTGLKKQGIKNKWEDVKLSLKSEPEYVLSLDEVYAYLEGQDSKTNSKKRRKIEFKVRDILEGTQQLNAFIEQVKDGIKIFIKRNEDYALCCTWVEQVAIEKPNS